MAIWVFRAPRVLVSFQINVALHSMERARKAKEKEKENISRRVRGGHLRDIWKGKLDLVSPQLDPMCLSTTFR